jgi:hypothetical protein
VLTLNSVSQDTDQSIDLDPGVLPSKGQFSRPWSRKKQGNDVNVCITIYLFSSRFSLAGVITISTSATQQHITEQVNK